MKNRVGYNSFYNLHVKRVIDIVLGLFLVIVSIPLLIIISIAIFVSDGLPVFYRAERGGYHGKNFRILKFRTMIKGADRMGGTTAQGDPRILPIGRFLRKAKLDEIPQFIQVLTGEISIIGPRPELVRYTEQYEGEEKLILEVRPGITDFSSIEFINLDEIVGSENADEMYEKYVLKKKNQLRVKYAKTVSLHTDLYIFFMTAYKVLEKIYVYVVKKEHR